MALVDPYDDSRIRYVIRRHQFDSDTNHFRWIIEKAYDNKKEFNKALEAAFLELQLRREMGNAHNKEQISGMTFGIGYLSNSQSRRALRQEEGTFLADNLLTRIKILISTAIRRIK